MNLEHVSVENAEYHPEHLPPEPDKSTAPPPKETRSSSEIARILRALSDKGLFGQDYVRELRGQVYL